MNFSQREIFHPYTIALEKGRQALFAFDLETARIHLTEAQRFSSNSTLTGYICALDFFQEKFDSIWKSNNLQEKIHLYQNTWSTFEKSSSQDESLKGILKKPYFSRIVQELENLGDEKAIIALNISDIYSIYCEAGCYQELYRILLLKLEEKPKEAQLSLMAANTSHILGYRHESRIFYGKYCLLADQSLEESQILDQEWRDLVAEALDEELPAAWIWIKAQLQGILPLSPESHGKVGKMLIQKDPELLWEEYQRNPSDDRIASQLWFKTLQKAESGEDIIKHRKLLKQIHPALFEMYMEKKRHLTATQR